MRTGAIVHVISLPSGKDPDEFLIANPQQAFENAIAQAKPLIVQYIGVFRASLAYTLKRKSSMKELFMTLSELDVYEVLQYKMHIIEAALCSLLFHHAECRVSLNCQEALRLLRNPTARDTALAILTENIDSLKLLWTQLGETEKMALLARGDEYCARMKGLSMAEKFRSTYYALRDRYDARRLRELTAKMQKSEATPEELSELITLKSARKGG